MDCFLRQYTDDIIEKYPAGTVISIHEAPVREGFYYWKGSEYQPGDESSILLSITVMALSLLGTVFVIILRRRKEDRIN